MGSTMRGLKPAWLHIALALISISAANAADLMPPPLAPIYIPPPAFSWAGPYLGATAAFANGFHTYDDLAGAFLGYPGLSNAQSKGFAAGGTLGFNLQAGSFVYGLEADLSWLGDKSTYVDPNGAINNFFPSETNRLNDLGTVRGRLGLAVDRTFFISRRGSLSPRSQITSSIIRLSSRRLIRRLITLTRRALAGSSAPVWNTPSLLLGR